MPKSIKFKNDTYMDSTGVIQDYSKENFGVQRTLHEVLQNGKKAIVQGTGWYNLATFNCVGGTHSNPCSSSVICIYQSYYYYKPEVHTLLIETGYNEATLKQLNYPQLRNSNCFTKYRLVQDNASTCVYRLEGYYNRDNPQVAYIERLSAYNPCVILHEPAKSTVTPAVICKEISTQTEPNAPVILYDGGATQDTVTLSQSAANFKRLKIYYCQNAYLGTSYNSIEVPDPNGRVINISEVILLETLNGSNYNGVYNLNRSYTISGTTIKLQHTRNNKIVGLNGTGTWGVADGIYIVKVIGYYDY